MKQADSLLLNALKAAIHNEKAMLGVLPQETQTELLRQAVRHGVLPLVLDACGNALKAARQWRSPNGRADFENAGIFTALQQAARNEIASARAERPGVRCAVPEAGAAAVLGCRFTGGFG